MTTDVNKDKLVADLKVVVADAEELLRATASQAGEKVAVARERIQASLATAKNSLPWGYFVSICFADLENFKRHFFSEIVIWTTGVEFIKIRYVSKSKTKLAKKIIDQKMYDLHYGDKNKREDPEMIHYTKMVNAYESGLSRLNELLNSHKITKKEFNKKRNALLKRLK